MLYMVDCKSPPAVLNTPVLHSLSLSVLSFLISDASDLEIHSNTVRQASEG
jgi:hypothetical protein